MILAFRYALNPSRSQQSRLSSHIGAVRFAYNWAYNYVESNWITRALEEAAGVPEEEKTPWVGWSAYDLRKALNSVKDEVAPWWTENSKEAFSTGTANFANAMKRWNNSRKNILKGSKVGFPKPKKKFRDNTGVRFATATVRLEPGARHLTLPRIGAIRLHEKASQLGKFLKAGARIHSATVKREHDRWFASLLVEVPDELAVTHFARKVNGRKKKVSIGADQGLKTRLFLSDGSEVENPRSLLKSQRKLRKLHKRLTRRRGYNKSTGEAASKRHEKASAEVSRQRTRAGNQRRDFLNKLTTSLVMNYSLIGVDKPNMLGMINGKLAKHVDDAGFYEFVRQLQYKAKRYDSTVIVLGKWYPSTKNCPDCGKAKATLTLSEQSYKCGYCGAVFDRDHDAALNIEAEAWRLHAESLPSGTAGASRVKALNGRGENSSGRSGNTTLKLSSVKRSELVRERQTQCSAREGIARGVLD